MLYTLSLCQASDIHYLPIKLYVYYTDMHMYISVYNHTIKNIAGVKSVKGEMQNKQ